MSNGSRNSNAFFDLTWRDKNLADWTTDAILPHELRSSVRGGSEVAEPALVAHDLGLTLPAFERLPGDEQEWAIATHRIKAKLKAIDVRESHDRVRRPKS